MNKFTCKYGLLHDKPTSNNEPSSNNGWIYRAYLSKLENKFDINQLFTLRYTFQKCHIEDELYFITRLPSKMYPPISRDEIIGMISLGFNPLKYGWFMYREESKPSYIDAIKELWSIRNEHRNYFWQKNLCEAYPIAMKLWWHDRHYILKKQGKKSNLFYWLMFQLYCITTLLQKNISAKNVLWLQLSDLDSLYWIKLINPKKNFKEYFFKYPDHPIRRILNES